ncbi:hypothetical protein MUB24_15525 [Lederbergia sp. NSJ-179]|uniref:hypothetical protein n=1 Tax=Lederbergia sp. NSJ-179 TaxID=2931402 RepID=UPI001FD62F8C|nr:hypothetical protein [Lederbergia sp. NSJ-179]MCJ7842279.1 hypothetical protein [Lederbergia sp. NSJ-179]
MKRSLLTVAKVLLIAAFASMLSGCSLLAALLAEEKGIVFGTGTFEDGIEEEKNVFLQDEDILFEAYVSEELKTTAIHFTLLKDEDDSETIYEEWDISVDPTWDRFLYEFHLVDEDGEFEPGNYIVRMFKNETEYVTEGMFTDE